jgi:hypothetical protein
MKTPVANKITEDTTDHNGTFYVPNPVIKNTNIDKGVCNAIA